MRRLHYPALFEGMDAENPKKAKSKSVSFSPSDWAEIEAIAARNHGGNRSDYFRMLFERDRRGDSARVREISSTILEDLARTYVPTRAAQLGDELARATKSDPAAAINQPVVVEQLLGALIAALRDPAFDPEAGVQILTPALREKIEGDFEQRTSAVVARFMDELEARKSALPFVAEEQAPYGAKTKKPKQGKAG